MADYKITSDRPGEPTMILISDANIASDALIDAVVGSNAEPGTVVHTAGYGVMKQKGLDGSWTAI